MSTEEEADQEKQSLSKEEGKPAEGTAPAAGDDDPARALDKAMKQGKGAAAEDDDPAKALERAMKK
jgi:hypothetical protein